jgi:hypothetical protein
MKTFSSSAAGLAGAGPGVKQIRAFHVLGLLASGYLMIEGQSVSMQHV